MAWPPENLLEFNREYAKLIANDRRLYSRLKSEFYLTELIIWPIIDRAIQARVAYYRGEVTRARRDTASYMLGGDPERRGVAFAEKLCKDLDWAIRRIQDAAASGESGLLDTSLWDVESIGNSLERITYTS